VTPSVEVLAVQYPGRQDRFTEPCIDNIRGLAERISEALLADPGPPLAFFGHSMGATVAFEVARGLRQHHGTRPRHLFASGRRAPSCRRYEYVHLRDDAGVVAELRGLGGTAARWLDDKGFLDLILPTVRNDFKAIETYSYEPGPPLDCPVTALVGNADPYTSIAEAEAWRAHSTGDFSLQVFRGGHFYLDMRQTDVANLIMSALHGTPAKRN
jgi:surfactin synthase thioesterase subunit